MKNRCPKLMDAFSKWLAQYVDSSIIDANSCGKLIDVSASCLNEKIYGKLENKETYIQAIIDFIAGMTDRFAVEMFNDLIT